MFRMIVRVLFSILLGVALGIDIDNERDGGQVVWGSGEIRDGHLVSFAALDAVPEKTDTECLSDVALNNEKERKDRETFRKQRWNEKETKRRTGEVAHKVRLHDQESIRQRAESRSKLSKTDCGTSKYFRRRRRRGGHSWNPWNVGGWGRAERERKVQRNRIQVRDYARRYLSKCKSRNFGKCFFNEKDKKRRDERNFLRKASSRRKDKWRTEQIRPVMKNRRRRRPIWKQWAKMLRKSFGRHSRNNHRRQDYIDDPKFSDYDLPAMLLQLPHSTNLSAGNHSINSTYLGTPREAS